MPLTLSNERDAGLGGNLRMTYVRATFDASYLTGGELFDPTADLTDDFQTVIGVFLNNRATAGLGYVPQYDGTAGTIALYEAGADGAALDEVASTTDVSAVVVDVLVVGT